MEIAGAEEPQQDWSSHANETDDRRERIPRQSDDRDRPRCVELAKGDDASGLDGEMPKPESAHGRDRRAEMILLAEGNVARSQDYIVIRRRAAESGFDLGAPGGEPAPVLRMKAKLA
jgi:hypothetical protein